jgi:hypothetical protein
MSESVAERLSKFTPDGSGLDRDRLLFEAGRASVRPRRGWPALCAALAAAQLVTLGLWLWPRPTVPAAPVDHRVPLVAEGPPPAAVEEKSALWQLRAQALATEGDLPSPACVEQPMVSTPPPPVLGTFPESLFH